MRKFLQIFLEKLCRIKIKSYLCINKLKQHQLTPTIMNTNYSYDIYFNDESDSNNKGMNATLEECQEYIRQNNGTNHSYFVDYKGGTVSIVCNETGETVYEEEVR